MEKSITVRIPIKDWIALRGRAKLAKRSLKAQAEYELLAMSSRKPNVGKLGRPQEVAAP